MPSRVERLRRRLPEHVGFTLSFAVRVALALILIVISLFTNRSFLGWGLFVVFAVLVVPVGRFRSFAAAFVPYGAVWFIFTFLRSLADETILAQTLNTRVAAFERWLFGGELPTIRLQANFYTPGEIHWWDVYFTFIHWSYFLIPHAVAVWLWWRHPARFRHYLAAMTLLLTIGLMVYFIIPSNPPWMAPEAVNTPGAPFVQRIMEPIAMELGGGLYEAGYRVVGESNPIAAMPSIHFAITFLLPFVARNHSRMWRFLAWFYAFSMGLALVYLGEHYVVDIVVGGMITAYSWFAAGHWLARVAPVLLSRQAARPVPEHSPQAT